MPAVAVKRGGQALFGMTGRKVSVDYNVSCSLNIQLKFISACNTALLLSFVRKSRILFVGVKSVNE